MPISTFATSSKRSTPTSAVSIPQRSSATPLPPYSFLLSVHESYVIDSEKEEQLFVSPANGTVLFASAAHGWCFSLRQFAELYAPLLGINKTKLVKYMWGDYILNAKNKTVSTWTPSSSSSPIFVKYVLSTLWKVYKSVFQHNEEMITTILSTIHVTLTPRELKTTDETIIVKLIMSRWLPLYKAVLSPSISVI